VTDEQFFATYSDRQARIRLPGKELVKDRQRGVRYEDECRGEFWSLGPHDKDRRRLLIWRVPKDNPHYDPMKPKLLKIPFLAFADETIENRDDILLPILHSIMENARA
jgi:hypothetical protein